MIDTATILMLIRQEMIAALQAKRHGYAFDPVPGQKLCATLLRHFENAGQPWAGQQALRELADDVASHQ